MISKLAMLAKKTIEAAWLNGPSYDLATQAAETLESAQLLQSPETAAELGRLRVELAQRTQDLADTHADREQLRARAAVLETTPLAWAERLDAKSLDNFLIALGTATEHKPMHEALPLIHELIGGFRSAVTDTEPEPTPSFFRPGRAYTRDLPFRAPEDRPNFDCLGVGTHPTKAVVRAFGFEQPGAGRPWVSASQRMEEWGEGWIDLGPIRSDRLMQTAAPARVLIEEGRDETPALTVYRASWDSMTLDQYTTETEARRHAEDHARRDLSNAAFDWIVGEEDGVAELVATVDGEENPTGYTVTALEIASTYDPDGDE
ncbi:hypothetical protein [Streptomyces sp. NPDC047042]|uniref:hypothetical protein n=1 Tax=Streptomyces sp. NPDC047042 TaxID=3154807 RepID=UPI0033D59A8B